MSPTKSVAAIRQYRFVFYFLAVVLGLGILYAVEPGDESKLPDPYDKLLPLHAPLGKPEKGDWLAEHHGEKYAMGNRLVCHSFSFFVLHVLRDSVLLILC
jgi:hypothetical protein